MQLFSNVRFYVLLFSFSLSALIYFGTTQNIPDPTVHITLLIEYYALWAATFLYLTLLATPLTRTFTFLPFRGQYVKARRALGVSAFYFGLLHATLVFFVLFQGSLQAFIPTNKYSLAALLGLTSLFILTLMASTANDFAIDKLGFKKWKFLHKFVYLVGLLIFFHAIILGSHFQTFDGLIPKIFLTALIFLLALESLRFFKYLKSKTTAP